MSVLLVDRGDASRVLSINIWNWRTIVAAIAQMHILSEDALARLEPFCGGLERDEARRVAATIESRLLPDLAGTTRLMLDGSRTDTPDDGVFHRDPAHAPLNYSTSPAVLTAFARFCAACEGFDQ